MAEQVFIDTDILVDFSQDQPEAVQTIAQLEKNYELSISVIVAMAGSIVGCTKHI